MTFCVILVYDRDNNVVHSFETGVQYDADRRPLGLIDFEAQELAAGKMRQVVDYQTYDEPIPEAVRVEIATATGLRPQDFVTLPPDHPWRIAHDRVKGSVSWPEWLGVQATDFKVELRPGVAGGTSRAKALVHRVSGYRRVRAEIEAAIKARVAMETQAARKDSREPQPVDISDLIGGPDRPLALDSEGRTKPATLYARPNLPLIGVKAPES